MKKNDRSLVISVSLLLIFILTLTGCQQAPTTTGLVMTPTSLPGSAPTSASAADKAYPAAPTAVVANDPAGAYPPAESPLPAGDPASAYPAGQTAPGGAGVQVRENLSLITARLITLAPDASDPNLIRLHVSVLTSEPAGGKDSFTQDLVNQEVDLLADANGFPALQAEDTFSANVTYRADENGGVYSASQIQKITP